MELPELGEGFVLGPQAAWKEKYKFISQLYSKFTLRKCVLIDVSLFKINPSKSDKVLMISDGNENSHCNTVKQVNVKRLALQCVVSQSTICQNVLWVKHMTDFQ